MTRDNLTRLTAAFVLAKAGDFDRIRTLGAGPAVTETPVERAIRADPLVLKAALERLLRRRPAGVRTKGARALGAHPETLADARKRLQARHRRTTE